MLLHDCHQSDGLKLCNELANSRKQSRGLTTVWASIPLMKMGIGLTPCSSMLPISCPMYICSVMTCLRYSNTATVGWVGSPLRGPCCLYHFMYSAGLLK